MRELLVVFLLCYRWFMLNLLALAVSKKFVFLGCLFLKFWRGVLAERGY